MANQMTPPKRKTWLPPNSVPVAQSTATPTTDQSQAAPASTAPAVDPAAGIVANAKQLIAVPVFQFPVETMSDKELMAIAATEGHASQAEALAELAKRTPPAWRVFPGR